MDVMGLLFLVFLTALNLSVATLVHRKIQLDKSQTIEMRNKIWMTKSIFHNRYMIVDNTSVQSGDDNDLKNIIYKELFSDFPMRWSSSSIVDWKSLRQIRMDSTLFIYFGSAQPYLIPGVMNFLDGVDRASLRSPKPHVCMIFLNKIDPRDTTSINRYAWDKKFFNSIILELNSNDPNESKGNTKIIKIHQFNRFNESHAQHGPAEVLTLFPEKFRNLYKCKIKVVVPLCPFLMFSPHSLCREEDFYASSPDFKFLRAMAERMNFTYEIFSASRTNLFHGASNSNVVSFHWVANGTADFIASLSFRTIPRSLLTFNTPTIVTKSCALVPYSTINQRLVTNEHAVTILFITLFVLGIFFLCSTLMRFDRRIWHLNNIFGMFLGIGWSRVPRRAIERIVFLIMIIAFTRFTSYLYADLLKANESVDLQSGPNSFEDLAASNLVPMSDKNIKMRLDLYNDDITLNNYSHRIIVDPTMLTCLKNILNFKNVTCIMTHKTYEQIRLVRSKSDLSKVRMSSACVSTTPLAYGMNPRNPYVKRFSVVVLQLQASGLLTKWEQDYLRVMRAPLIRKEEEMKTASEIILLRCCLLGYGIAVLVLSLEIVFQRLKLKFQRKTVTSWFGKEITSANR